jgi:cysteinyl-tRNA synthetase
MIHLANRILEDKSLSKATSGKELITEINNQFKKWSMVLALFAQPPADFLDKLRSIKIIRKKIDLPAITALIEDRQNSRKNKDFAKADAIRAQLNDMGVEVRDTTEGIIWDLF